MSKNAPSVYVRRTGDSMWTIPSRALRAAVPPTQPARELEALDAGGLLALALAAHAAWLR
jgi:1,2-phenylacetyl-CoA epoxidase PaaB subunit